MSIAKKVIAVLMLLGSLAGGFQYMEVRTEKANSDGFREGFIAGYLSGGRVLVMSCEGRFLIFAGMENDAYLINAIPALYVALIYSTNSDGSVFAFGCFRRMCGLGFIAGAATVLAGVVYARLASGNLVCFIGCIRSHRLLRISTNIPTTTYIAGITRNS